MADLVELKNKLSELTILEMAELVKTLEQEWGVSAVAPVAVAGGSANVSADAGAEKSTVDVVLASAGASKIAVIKVVREITGLALGDAKALVDGALKAVKDGVANHEAATMKKKLEEAGATLELH